MADTYEARQIEERTLWDRFVRDAIGGTIFSTSAWLKAAQTALGGEICLYGCYKNDRHLIAGCPLLRMEKGGIRSGTTPLLTPYGGFLYAPLQTNRAARVEAEQHRAASCLLDMLEEQFDYLQLSHAPALEDVRMFTWRNWDVRIGYTYLYDLRDLDTLWEEMENRTNTVVRKAERGGIAVERCDDPGMLVRQYEMIYEKQGIRPPIHSETVRAFYEAARDADLCQMYWAKLRSDEVASVVVFLHGFETLYAWVSGANPAYNNSGATSLLYWRVFEEMSGQYSHFDFVGANLPPIAKFKRGFGGRLTSYFVVERYGSPLFRIVHRGGGTLKRLVQRVGRI